MQDLACALETILADPEGPMDLQSNACVLLLDLYQRCT